MKKSLMRFIILVIVCVVVGLTSRQVAAEQRYSITDLGIDGESVGSVGINNDGQIVIYLNLQNNAPTNKVFLLEEGEFQELPTLGGRVHGFTVPNGMGVMVGSSQTPDGRRHAVVYLNGELQDWGSLGEIGSMLARINDSGLIIGNIFDRNSTSAVVFNGPNDITHLGTLGGNISSASDLNNLGQIVGISLTGEPFVDGETDKPAQEAFLYENGQMVGLGTLGGNTSNGFGINDLGQVVGDSSLPNGEMHAFVYSAARGMVDLGAAGQQSLASEINELGIIIGGIEQTPGNWRATIFDEMNGPTLLQDLIPPDSGWLRLNSATDINDWGQIVGTGVINGGNHAFLLTPIPEPSTLLLATLGIAGLLGRRGWRSV